MLATATEVKTCGTMMADANMPSKDVMRAMGHADLKTMERYFHSRHTGSQTDALNAHLAEALKPKLRAVG